ncbi:TrlF family AAA-like ATPase [Amycolatopsis acidiphila]|nr:hypothetical protein GCM10017788_36550 [Amycolatopsis acidiphila]
MRDDSGAHFYRCDFQVHTPRDAQWKGRRPQTPEDRKSYANKFVAKCRELELHAVAITDHHDLTFAPVIRAAARNEVGSDGRLLPPDRQLVVFPGVELTLGVPCQALLILDADLPDDRLPQVLEALACEQSDEQAEKLPDVKPLEHISSLKALYELLDQRTWLKGRYIVLPNVTDGGHQTLMRTGMQPKYKEMPCVGGYLDGSVADIGKGNARKFAGEDPAWGSKPIALFQTSDSRSETFEDLGKYSTWVKWAEPTAEALRQACLGHQSRISQQAPALPGVFISRLNISNSKFLGPLDVAFNSQYNSVIGGRGTGKSTILDYLRWGLCDQVAQAGDDELADPTVRREKLIENTLKLVGGQVEVYFTINDIPHVVRRDSRSGEILLKVGDDEFSKVRESHVRSLLPIHAYSQKQLSSVALRVDELTRFVTSPIKRDLDTVDQKIVEFTGRLRENYAKVQRAQHLDVAIRQQQLAERSLAEQATNLRNSLTDLSESDREVLNAKPGYDRVRQSLRNQERDLRQVASSAVALLDELGRVSRDLDGMADVPERLRDLVTAVLTRRQAAVDDLRQAVAVVVAAFEQARVADSAEQLATVAVDKALSDFDVLYEEVKQRSTSHQARLKELAQVEEQRTSAADLLQRHELDRRALGDPRTLHTDLRSEFVALFRERSGLLSEECGRLTELSRGLLRASISRGRGIDAIEQKFRAAIQGSGVRGGRVEQLFSGLRDESDPVATWEEVLNEIESILLLEEDAEHTSEATPNLTRLGFPLADQQRIRNRITPDAWLDLALTPINDEPVFEYQTKEKEFIAFSAASAGQQATALLRVLLSQTGVPLIIDQPEEDLDSQVIQDVVSQIWKAKEGRQIIFASHNANLVVNGDAELVVACDYRKAGDQSGGKISLQGAIDIPGLRSEITKVMEGGEKAFRLRKERYGF